MEGRQFHSSPRAQNCLAMPLGSEEQSSHQLKQNQGFDYLPATLQISYLPRGTSYSWG